MRVLLINPEFPPSFWSLPVGVSMAGAKAVVPPLGLLTVAALLPGDWELRLADLNTRSLTEEDWVWADMVMLTGMFVQRTGLLAILKEAKQRGKITVVGGPYATSCSEEILGAGCDFFFKGEAENTIHSFLSALKGRKKHGIFSSDEKPAMSVSPIPRYDLLNFNDYTALLIQASRGCPFDCEFCDVVNLYGRTMRYKTPEQVTGELEALFHLGWTGQIFIGDDNFIGSKHHARSILEELIPWSKSRGEPFSFITQASVNLGQDLDMIDLMTEANFHTVFVGIETPDEDVLAMNRKFQNIRNPLVESINNMAKNGLSVIASFIIGFDGEKPGAGEIICAFAEQTSIPILMVNVLIAPGNTRLWKRLEKEGRLFPDMMNADSIGCWPNFAPSRSTGQIMEEFVNAWEYLYEPSRFLERAYRYHLMMRPTRSALARSPGSSSADGSVPSRREPLRRRLLDLLAVIRLAWWQGIKPSYRMQFWKQLIGILRHNRSRTVKYLVSCAYGEDMFRLAREMRYKVAAQEYLTFVENRERRSPGAEKSA